MGVPVFFSGYLSTERQCNHTREWGDTVKLLLLKFIGLHIANAGVATVTVIEIKIVNDAGLGIR